MYKWVASNKSLVTITTDKQIGNFLANYGTLIKLWKINVFFSYWFLFLLNIRFQYLLIRSDIKIFLQRSWISRESAGHCYAYIFHSTFVFILMQNCHSIYFFSTWNNRSIVSYMKLEIIYPMRTLTSFYKILMFNLKIFVWILYICSSFRSLTLRWRSKVFGKQKVLKIRVLIDNKIKYAGFSVFMLFTLPTNLKIMSCFLGRNESCHLDWHLASGCNVGWNGIRVHQNLGGRRRIIAHNWSDEKERKT